jgi:radical SAM superfamily enzyme YgiQ (UPF0313 family)
MKISLATSLHLDHGAVSPATLPGDPLRMQPFVPVGLLSLKATADRADLNAKIRVTEVNGLINAGMIANDDRFYDHLVDAILEPDDALVGLMTDADSLHHSVIIAELIKRRSPGTLVCLGGPSSSPIADLILETFPFIDFVVRGEGEITFVKLIRSLQRGGGHSGIAGLTWRYRNTVVENVERGVVEDLDELPIPAFDAYDMSSEAPLYLDVGRGCPFECDFCGTAPFWKRKYRMKSIERIIAEMRLVRDDYGRTHVNYSHDIFTCDREWTLRFCNQLAEANLGMTWTCSTRTDIITPDVLAAMANAGCIEIYYGIESGSSDLQRKIRKNLDLDWAREIVRSTAAVGIHPITGFIVGYPMETMETLRETLEKFFDFLRVGGFRGHLFTLCPYHDSPMYRAYQSASELAECYDLPLSPGAGALGEQLRRQHPIIFASTHRYPVPQVPARVIAAGEEISARLVLLKSIWPLLLPHYDSPLEWYLRWVEWIEVYNAKQRPGTRWPHQTEVGDLLQFVAEEVSRLGLDKTDLGDLVRYEQLKLDAASLTSPPPARRHDVDTVDADAVIVRRCDFVAAPFRCDIRTLLAGQQSEESESSRERWVVCAKNAEGDLKTVQVPALGRLILEIAGEPRRVSDLFSDLPVDDTKGEAEANPFLDAGVHLVRQLVSEGLLEEVVTQ